MKNNLVLNVDLGTSGCGLVSLDENSTVLGSTCRNKRSNVVMTRVAAGLK